MSLERGLDLAPHAEQPASLVGQEPLVTAGEVPGRPDVPQVGAQDGLLESLAFGLEQAPGQPTANAQAQSAGVEQATAQAGTGSVDLRAPERAQPLELRHFPILEVDRVQVV